jgi:hypothetical protein
MKKFLVYLWVFILVFLVLGSFAYARGSKKKVRITNAVVFPDTERIYISGSNFEGKKLKVWLENEGERYPLEVYSSTDIEIETYFPPDFEGTYRLVVAKCKYWKKFRAHRSDGDDDGDDDRFWGRGHCSEDSLAITVGAVGSEGPQGEVGPQGDPGPPGAVGPEGPQGEVGPQGDPGPPGADGARGEQGEKGDKGDKGYTGATGATGPSGEKGDTGPAPAHQWVDTSLQFETPGGGWGSAVDLKGEKGDPGAAGGASAKSWSSMRTGALVFAAGQSYDWSTIPGLQITFTLDRTALVHMISTGMQRAQAPGYAHNGYRFVINDSGRGSAAWGQRILMSSQNDTNWWTPWSFSDSIQLGAGTHTIKVQVKGNSSHSAVCGEINGTTPGYTECHLSIMAFYQ